MNKYKEPSFLNEEKFLKDDEEYLLKESRPLEESSIKNLNNKKMNQFIEDILTDKKLTSLLYATSSKNEIKSYLKTQKTFENLYKNKKKIKNKYENKINPIIKNKNRKDAYYQMKLDINNYKTYQENYQSKLKLNNHKKYLEIKKDLENERNERNKEIQNHRIFGFKRAYNTLKEKLEQNKEKEILYNDIKANLENNKNINNNPLITLPKIKLNMVNVYSRLYNNAVLSTPLNKKIQKLYLNTNILNLNNNKLKKSLSQNKPKKSRMLKNHTFSFSIKNALTSNNGKEFTVNITEQNINKCLNKYSGGPQNTFNSNDKNESYLNIDKYNENKLVNFYDLEEKNTGNTYLHLATSDNCAEIVHYFLEKGIDVNKQNNNGDTALHIALRNNNLEIVRIIMGYKPALDIPNNDGVIPFEMFSKQMKIDFEIDNLTIENPSK